MKPQGLYASVTLCDKKRDRGFKLYIFGVDQVYIGSLE